MYYPKGNQASFQRDDVKVAVRCAEVPSTEKQQHQVIENALIVLVVGMSALAMFWAI